MKPFVIWTQLKQQLHASSVSSTPHQRQIWWCSLGINIGSEQDGKNAAFERPVLIIRRLGHDLYFVVPLTSQIYDSPYALRLLRTPRASMALLSQARTISRKRLSRKHRYNMTNLDFKRVLSALEHLLFSKI